MSIEKMIDELGYAEAKSIEAQIALEGTDPINHKYCLRCGYIWESRKESPRQCPYCKSPKWDKEKR